MIDEGPLAHLAAHELVLPPDWLFTGEAAEDNARRTSRVTSKVFDSGAVRVFLWDDLRARGALEQTLFLRLCNQTRIKGNTSLPGIPWRLQVTSTS